MKSTEGKAVFVDLLKKCDIIMENFGPGVLDRFGFTWEKIHEINPKIVMGSIKGFGSSGPYAEFKAYENVAQAMGGEQRAAVGNQTGGRVMGFLHTSDFAGDFAAMTVNGVRFLEQPRHEAYGSVAVFEDLYGNKWDLLEPKG